MLTMCLGGLWHGASWTFVLWGGYHGILLIVYRLVREWKEAVKKSRVGLVTRSRTSRIDRLIKTVNIMVFFHLTCLGWLLFRASSPAQVHDMLLGLVARASMPDPVILVGLAMPLLIYSLPLLLMELWEYHARDPWVALKTSLPACSALLLAIFYGILVLARDDAQSFLYLQF